MRNDKSLILVISVILCFGQILFSEESKDLKVTGGLIYSTWVESDSSITGGITIESPSVVSNNINPLQILLLVDVSRSMMGSALQSAKESAETIVKSLRDKDIFGLITYSGYAKVVTPMQPLNSNNRRSIISAISRLKHDNKRNLSDGLKKTSEQLSRYKGQRSHGQYVLLLTNGDADDGVTDKTQLLLMAKSISDKYKLAFSTFGYDRYFDADFLISLAKETRGQAYFIDEDNVQNMKDYFKNEIHRVSNISAKNVTVEIETPSGSTLGNVNGGILNNEGKIIVGNVQAGIKKPVYFDIIGRPSKRKDLIINVSFQEPIRLTSRKARIYIDLQIGTGKPSYDKNYSPVLISHTFMKDLAETVFNIKEKNARIAYVKQLNEKIEHLEHANNGMNSDYISNFINQLKQIVQDLNNGAIESDVLMKKIKYQFHELSYAISSIQDQ